MRLEIELVCISVSITRVKTFSTCNSEDNFVLHFVAMSCSVKSMDNKDTKEFGTRSCFYSVGCHVFQIVIASAVSS